MVNDSPDIPWAAACKSVYWSYLALRRSFPGAATRYLFRAALSRGFRGRTVIAGDFIFNNFGDMLGGTTLATVLRRATAVLTPPMAAPYASSLLVGAGGLLRPDIIPPLKPYRAICGDATPSGLVGVGLNCELGATASTEWVNSLRDDISQFDFVTARDHITWEWLRSFGVQVHGIMPDVVLLADVDVGDRKAAPCRGPFVIICPCCHTAGLRELGLQILTLYVSLVESLAGQGFNVLLCPLQKSPDPESDHLLCERVREVASGPVTVLPAVPTAREFASLCRQAAGVISGRLHGAVLAARAGVPPLILAYNYKQNAFAEAVQMQPFCLDVHHCDATQVMEAWRTLYETRTTLAAELKHRVGDLRAFAESQMRLLASWAATPSHRPPRFSPPEEFLERFGLAENNYSALG
jgi:hypothetical protein